MISVFGFFPFVRRAENKNVWDLSEPQKKRLLSIESWLFNKNPYFMVYDKSSPYKMQEVLNIPI